MRRSAFLLMFALLPGIAVQAEAQQTVARQHTVEDGDTLWGLANRFCADPFRWPEIYDGNRNIVSDPDLIYPGQELTIVCAPREDLPEPEQPVVEPEMAPQPDEPFDFRNEPSVFRREFGLQISDMEVPDYPVMSRDASWSAQWLNREGRGIATGEVTELLAGELTRTAMPYQRIRVSSPHAARVGDIFQVARLDHTIGGGGDVMTPTGMVSVVHVEEEGFEGVVLKSYDRVVTGDLVVPAPTFDLEPSDRAVAVSDGTTARIIAFGDPHELQQLGDIAILNMGSNDGVALGDEYVLMTGGREGWSGRVAGRLQVVRLTPQTASARITAVSDPVFTQGLEVILDRKMR